MSTITCNVFVPNTASFMLQILTVESSASSLLEYQERAWPHANSLVPDTGADLLPCHYWVVGVFRRGPSRTHELEMKKIHPWSGGPGVSM